MVGQDGPDFHAVESGAGEVVLDAAPIWCHHAAAHMWRRRHQHTGTVAMAQRYEDLFGRELQDAIARCPIAWVPLGILERHGEHLPYGLDGFKAHGVCLRLADALGGVVLPPIHVAGVHEPWCADHDRYARWRREVGDFYVRPETFRMLVEDVADGLINLGFTTVCLYSGHYPRLQIDALRAIADDRTARGPARVIAFHEPDATDGQGDHAGKCETSLHMALGGETRLDAIRPEHAGKLGFFSDRRPGPMEASAPFGQTIIRQTTDWFANVLKHPELPASTFRRDLK